MSASLESVKSLVSEELAKLKAKVRKDFGDCPDPALNYTDLKGRVVGRAFGSRLIQVNAKAAMVLGEEYRGIVIHEFAHILNKWLATYRPGNGVCGGDCEGHGRGWKNVMIYLGVAPERCYDNTTANVLAAAGVYGEVFEYHCPKHPEKIYPFSTRKHNNVVRKRAYYVCPCCKTTLVRKV